MISEPEQKIREYDPQFYERVKGNMHNMPDFRHQEAMKRFKQEPQNNWAILLNELEAIGIHANDVMVLNALNTGKREEMDRFIGSEFISNFVFSYPALLWIMMNQGNKAAIALSISEGKFLEEIPLMIKDIPYIRCMKTAKILYERFPFLLKNAKFRKDKRWNISSGHLYWLLVEGTIDYKRLNYDKIAYTKDMELIKNLFPMGVSEDIIHKIYDHAIQNNFTEAVEYFLTTFPSYFEDYDMTDTVHCVASTGNIELIRILFDNLDDVDKEDLRNDPTSIWMNAIDHSHVDMIKFMLQQDFLIENLTKSLDKLEKIFDNENANTPLHLLLDYLTINKVSDILRKAIKYASKEKISILLKKPGLSLESYIRTIIFIGRTEILELFLGNVTMDLSDMINVFLRDAIDNSRKDMIPIPLAIPGIEEHVNMKLLEQAKRMLQ